MDQENMSTSKNRRSRTVEQTYTKLDQREHVLVRPDTYVGSVNKRVEKAWVLDDGNLMKRQISFVPALYKIFDEILVNAADNKQRDQKMSRMQVTIDPEKCEISVLNNGKGIPIEMHKKEKMYVPELIFGNLLTSDNYDDNRKKVTGGRNGFGAKLCNIFSNKFTVETVDSSQKKKFKQTWSKNMTHKTKPKITACKDKDYTKVTFVPDLEKFGMCRLDSDAVSLFKKRVYDMAGVTDHSVKVSLNGTRIGIRSFEEYVKLYQKSLFQRLDEDGHGEDRELKFLRVNERWEVAVCVSDGQFEQISFVNSICTIKGGSHVDYITDQLTSHLVKEVAKKNKKSKAMSKGAVKQFLCVFVNSLIENPSFGSQTKETLTSSKSEFGSDAVLPTKFLKLISSKKMGVVDKILQFASYKSRRIGKEGTKVKTLSGISKLCDANKAGTRDSEKCTLILTEGDSAKTLAISGMSVVGRDYWGVFPLKGKPLNVREAHHAQISKNVEIQNIIKIMGLKRDKNYALEGRKSLRYGSLMIMADQDHDGSHIKGLVINFIHWYNPSLLECDGFLLEFVTPIVKATKGKKQQQVFYTLPDYEEWKDSFDGPMKGWRIKYYKGLGTSTSKEAKEYFNDLEKHRLDFEWVAGDEEFIHLAFSKSKTEGRKDWIREFQRNHLDRSTIKYDQDTMLYKDFFDKEYILYAQESVARAIPELLDGLKPSQRKVLFSCFKRKLKNDIKVAQLAGYVSEHSAYHHGEMSLQKCIVAMAQDFVGSNNINLLFPSGQFGTRLMGGADHASARYIFTRLSKLARLVFHPDDDALLEYNEDDGNKVEPVTYCPVIPMALVNGCAGIATGWSTSIPNYNPKEIIAMLRKKLAGHTDLENSFEVVEDELEPWYRDFNGDVKKKNAGAFLTRAVVEVVDEDEILISELPVGKWTQSYKEFLESLTAIAAKAKSKGKKKGKKAAPKSPPKKASLVLGFQENHTDTKVSFTVQLTPGIYKFEVGDDPMTNAKFVKDFKLEGSLSIKNMVLLHNGNAPRTFKSVGNILDLFYDYRLDLYEKRKEHMLSILLAAHTKLRNQVRFIKEFMDGTLVISRRPENEIIAELLEKSFDVIKPEKSQNQSPEAEDEDEDDSSEPSGDAQVARVKAHKGYDYLLNMSIRSLTMEKVRKLTAQAQAKQDEIDALEKLDPADIWVNDLDALEEGIEADDLRRQKDADAEERARSKRQSGRRRKRPAKKKPRRKPLTKPAQPKVTKPAQPKVTKPAQPKVTKPMAAAKAPKQSSLLGVMDNKLSVSSKSRAKAAPQKRKSRPKSPIPVFDSDSDSASDFEDTVPLSMRMQTKKQKTASTPSPRLPAKTKKKAYVSPKRRSPKKRAPVARKAIPATSIASGALSVSRIRKLTVKELKVELKQRGEKVSGKKCDLVDRLIALVGGSPVPAPPKAKAAAKKTGKRKITKLAESSVSEDDWSPSPAKKTKTSKRKPPAPDSDSEEEAPVRVKASRRATQKKKQIVVSSDSESEFEAAADPTPRPTRSRRGGKRVVYNLESPDLDDSYVEPDVVDRDSESEFNEEFDDDEDDDSDWS